MVNGYLYAPWMVKSFNFWKDREPVTEISVESTVEEIKHPMPLERSGKMQLQLL
jgi:hypothetical protein